MVSGEICGLSRISSKKLPGAISVNNKQSADTPTRSKPARNSLRPRYFIGSLQAHPRNFFGKRSPLPSALWSPVIGTRNHLRCRTLLHNSPCRYDRNCIRQVRHKRHVMGDEEIGERMRCLKVKQQVGNLRLCREVEARKRFVQHQQFWLQRERPRDGQSLSLPPAEFHHRAVCRVRRKANFAHYFLGTRPAILLAAAPLNQ